MCNKYYIFYVKMDEDGASSYSLTIFRWVNVFSNHSYPQFIFRKIICRCMNLKIVIQIFVAFQQRGRSHSTTEPFFSVSSYWLTSRDVSLVLAAICVNAQNAHGLFTEYVLSTKLKFRRSLTMESSQIQLPLQYLSLPYNPSKTTSKNISNLDFI